MANPVNNGGITAKVNVGKLLDVDVRIGGTAKVSEDQGKGIFGNVSENFTRNPNHSRPVQHAEDANQPKPAKAGDDTAPPALAKDHHDDDGAPPANRRGNTNQNVNQNNQNVGEDGELAHRPNRGENGAENGRGPHKMGNQTQTQTQETPPIVIMPNDEKGTTTQNTPPIIVFPD